MSIISLRVDYIHSLSPNLGKNCVRVSNVKSGISSVKANLDHKVLASRNIGARLTETYRDVAQLETKLNQLQAFVNKAVPKYAEAENRVLHLAPKYGINVGSAAQASAKQQDHSGTKHKEESIWDKLNTGVNAVKTDVGHVTSKIKKLVDKGGPLHTEFEIGKAVAGIGLGVIAVVGSGVGEVFSGGTATPIAILTAVYGVNEIINKSSDLVNAIRGNDKKIGEVDVLKDSATGFLGSIGKLFGHEKLGKTIGTGAYDVGKAATFFTGAYGALKDIKNLSKFKPSGFKQEVKTLVPNIKRVYSRVGRDVNGLHGVRKLKQAANPVQIFSDLKSVKKVKDLSNIQSVKYLKKIDYGKTLNKTVKIVISEPSRKLAEKTTNMVNAYKGGMAIKDAWNAPNDGKESYHDLKKDVDGLVPN